jgi:hypothetical protein
VRALPLLVLFLAPTARAAGMGFEVPVDVGIGPAGYVFWGPVADDRLPSPLVPHSGVKLNVKAIIDQQLIARNKNRIPRQYQKYAAGVTEVRVSPSIFIPDALIISPAVAELGNTGLYGITWRPFSLGVPLSSGKSSSIATGPKGRAGLSAGLLLTYMFMHSDALPTTHFVRPGIDLALDLELMFTPRFGIGLGYAHQFYIPQELGGFGVGNPGAWIFHASQVYLQLHFRFPYRV